jgi:hypothetical protein
MQDYNFGFGQTFIPTRGFKLVVRSLDEDVSSVSPFELTIPLTKPGSTNHRCDSEYWSLASSLNLGRLDKFIGIAFETYFMGMQQTKPRFISKRSKRRQRGKDRN